MRLSLLLMICLSTGCANIFKKLPKIEDQERCLPAVMVEACFCHQYRISKEFVGRVSETVEHPLAYCDKLIGFSPDSWVNIRLWIDEIFDLAESKSKKKFTRPVIETPEDIDNLVLELK